MEIHGINIGEIHVAEGRQRSTTDGAKIVELATSIARNGIIHPVVVRVADGKTTLVAGYRRLSAMRILWAQGEVVRCGPQVFADNLVPCLYIGEIDPVDAFEIELEENIRREDLPWQDRARSVARLYELRGELAAARGEPQPTVADITQELHETEEGGKYEEVRSQLIVAKHLSDPEVAAAPTVREAFKLLKRKEELEKSAELGAAVGRTFNAGMHKLYHGNCLEVMNDLPPGTFDIILTDPPYGIDADDFGDSGGKAGGAHEYSDSYEKWPALMTAAVAGISRIAKPSAHVYIFCDPDRFHFLRDLMETKGWSPFRTPIIWVNPTANRAPWPLSGPQRKWQSILYAIRGSRTCTKLYPDIATVPSDPNINHRAQKPVGIYQNLLARSARPGDRVIDPFCGTGTIFPAAHEIHCIATGIEADPAVYGIAISRLKALA